MTHRSSLTLAHDMVEPRPGATVHPDADVGPYAFVAITPEFVVQSQNVEALLAISTAFADAALALGRLQDQQQLAVTG